MVLAEAVTQALTNTKLAARRSSLVIDGNSAIHFFIKSCIVFPFR